MQRLSGSGLLRSASSFTPAPGGSASTSRWRARAGCSSSSLAALASDRSAAVSARAASSRAWPRVRAVASSAYAARSSGGRITSLTTTSRTSTPTPRTGGAEPPRSSARPTGRRDSRTARVDLVAGQRLPQCDLDGQVDHVERVPGRPRRTGAASADRPPSRRGHPDGHPLGGEHVLRCQRRRCARAPRRGRYSRAARDGRRWRPGPSTRVKRAVDVLEDSLLEADVQGAEDGHG